MSTQFGDWIWLRYRDFPVTTSDREKMRQGWITRDQYPEGAWSVKNRQFRILEDVNKQLTVEWLPEVPEGR